MPAIEEWICPACGATALRPNPAKNGIWVAAVDTEVIALCARQHHRHDRRGRPLAPPDRPGALTWQELAASPPGECWLPVVAVDAELDAFVTPGIAFRRSGASYDVLVLDDIEPSALVGSLRPLLARGRVLGAIPSGALHLDERHERIDAASLSALTAVTT